MNPPSMSEAAKIRDVAKRHAYVFDNGLSSPDFFDLDKRMESEEFHLLRERIKTTDSVLEVGCFTGLNLLGLRKSGHTGFLRGLDFVWGAIHWLDQESERLGANINAQEEVFPFDTDHIDDYHKLICFDVLEHQRNVGDFLDAVPILLKDNGRALFLVPKGREYYDCGHVAFFPDVECLRNVLDYVFEVEEIFELKTCKKLFAACRRRN